MQPIFLISLPRSGSTLLQKILTLSSEIHSVPEPWLMLPFAYMFKEGEMLTRYGHRTFQYAIEDFVQHLPNGKSDFYQSLNSFALDLYRKTCPESNARFFIDKTPRYYLIIPFLAEVFPNAKFIFLFRNPLEVLASILTTWSDNRFYIHNNYIDLFGGPFALAEGARRYCDRAISVHYGDMVRNPETEIQKICNYIGIKYAPSMFKDYGGVNLTGTMGDHHGINEFNRVSTDSLEKWKTVLVTRYRKKFAKKYVHRLGDEVLGAFNTSTDSLLADISSISHNQSGSFLDAFDHSLSTAMRLLGKEHFRQLWRGIGDKKTFFPYY